MSNPAPPTTLHDAKIALAAQLNSMLGEPIAHVEELEAPADTVTTEEEQLKLERQRVLLWIEWRLSDLHNIKTRLSDMEDEDKWNLE